MRFPQATLLSSAETLFRIAAVFVGGKIAALVDGPSGVAAFGQLTNMVNVFVLVASGAIFTLIVDASARYATEPTRWSSVAPSIGWLLLLIALPLGALTFIFAEFLAKAFLQRESFAWIFRGLGLASGPLLLFYAVVAVLASRNLAASLGMRLLASAFSLLACILGGFLIGPAGAAFAIVAGPVVVLCVLALNQEVRAGVQAIRPRELRFDSQFRTRAASFLLMGSVSAIALPAAIVIGRNTLAASTDWTEVGYWEVAYRLGEIVCVFGIAALSAYFVPRLSRANGVDDLRALTNRMLVASLALVASAAIVLFVAPRWWIALFYSGEAVAAETILAVQFVASAIRLASWSFAIHLQLQGRAKSYITLELIWVAVFVSSSGALCSYEGMAGLSTAYLLANLIYCCLSFSLFRRMMTSLRRQSL